MHRRWRENPLAPGGECPADCPLFRRCHRRNYLLFNLGRQCPANADGVLVVIVACYGDMTTNLVRQTFQRGRFHGGQDKLFRCRFDDVRQLRFLVLEILRRFHFIETHVDQPVVKQVYRLRPTRFRDKGISSVQVFVFPPGRPWHSENAPEKLLNIFCAVNSRD